MPSTIFVPHRDSADHDIKKVGRSFGHAIICSVSGCSYTIAWDEDVYTWFKDMGLWNTGKVYCDEPYPHTMVGIRFEDPGMAALFKLTFLSGAAENPL